jgi:hypothetical protein
MNTDKTLHNKFIESVGKNDNPIWYYKELQAVSIDYVIWNLLKETFVVEINGIKHEITFGKNRKNEIGQYIKYSDIEKSCLCSYEVINKGFNEGKWFIITEIDTAEDFKKQYNDKKEEYKKISLIKMYKTILTNVIMNSKDLTENIKATYIQEVENSSLEKLENLFKSVIETSKE